MRRLVVILAAGLLLSACVKKIELEPGKWYCASASEETIWIGVKTPTPIKRKVCTVWRKL